MHAHSYLCLWIAREIPTFSIHDPHTEVGGSTSPRRLFWQRPVHKAMEASPGPCKPVLDPLELRIPTFVAAQTEVDSAPKKPSGWRSGSAQGQAGRSQLLAYGQSQCHFPWERWTCKEGRSENNWPRLKIKTFLRPTAEIVLLLPKDW